MDFSSIHQSRLKLVCSRCFLGFHGSYRAEPRPNITLWNLPTVHAPLIWLFGSRPQNWRDDRPAAFTACPGDVMVGGYLNHSGVFAGVGSLHFVFLVFGNLCFSHSSRNSSATGEVSTMGISLTRRKICAVVAITVPLDVIWVNRKALTSSNRMSTTISVSPLLPCVFVWLWKNCDIRFGWINESKVDFGAFQKGEKKQADFLRDETDYSRQHAEQPCNQHTGSDWR